MSKVVVSREFDLMHSLVRNNQERDILVNPKVATKLRVARYRDLFDLARKQVVEGDVDQANSTAWKAIVALRTPSTPLSKKEKLLAGFRMFPTNPVRSPVNALREKRVDRLIKHAIR